MCGDRPSYDTGRGPSKRKRPARSVRTVAAPRARVHAEPVRLPEVNLGSSERTAVDGENDARQDVSLADRGPSWRCARAERPSSVASNVGAHRGAAGAETPAPATSENERPEREADCDEPSHTLRSNRRPATLARPRPSLVGRRVAGARLEHAGLRPCRPPAPERRDAGRASCRATPRAAPPTPVRRCRPHQSSQTLKTSFSGPSARAGFSAAPVSGPAARNADRDREPDRQAGDRLERPPGSAAVANTTQTRRNVMIASRTTAGADARSSRFRTGTPESRFTFGRGKSPSARALRAIAPASCETQ